MKENYLIEIEGTVTSDGEDEVVNLKTTGAFYKKNDNYYICYNESAATGFEDSKTILKIWSNGVSMVRHGPHYSNLIIEKGAVNMCNYDTPAGSIILDINGIDIVSELNEQGGNIKFSYSLNSGGMLISDNQVKINVKEM